MMKLKYMLLLTAGMVFCSVVAQAETVTEKTIAQAAVSAGNCNGLIAAAKVGGLFDKLDSEEPLTLFAPSDEAFAKLPAGTLESLLLPENKAQLAAMLNRHVVSGSYPVAKLGSVKKLKTLAGQPLAVEPSAEGLKVDSAAVVKADLACSNGILHIVDSVLLPGSEEALPEKEE